MKLKELPINIHIRLWGSFVNRLISSSIFPFMAIYLSEQINTIFASIYLSTMVIVSFVINIIAGYVIDKLPRKIVLTTSSYAEALTLFFLTISIWNDNIIIFISSYTVYNIVSTFRRPSLTAIVQDSVNEQNRDLTYRLDYWLINLSLAIGTFLGGILYSNHKIILFAAAFISTTILSIIYSIFISETHEYISEKKKKNIVLDVFYSYYEVFKDKRYVMLTIGLLIIITAELSTSSYVSVRLSETFKTIRLFNFEITGVRMFSFIGLINTFIVVAFTFITEKITIKINKKKVLLFGMGMYTIGYSLNMSANVWWLIIGCIMLASFGELLCAPLVNSEILRLIPSNQRGAYNAFSSLGDSGAELLARLSILTFPSMNPLFMTCILFILLIIGTKLLFDSLFKFN